MDDSIIRAEKPDLDEMERTEEIEKSETPFTEQDEKRLVRKLDFWYVLPPSPNMTSINRGTNQLQDRSPDDVHLFPAKL